MRSRRAVGVLALASILAFPELASAQLDARDAPTHSGPLNAGQRGCDGGKEMHEGNLVAHVRLCYRVFLFDPDSEDSAGRDYGVIWLQSNVDAEPSRLSLLATYPRHISPEPAATIPFGEGTVSQQITVDEKSQATVRIPVNFTYSGIGAAGRALLKRRRDKGRKRLTVA